MKKQRRNRDEIIDVKRCLRLTRPLVAKTHQLNDLKLKSPSMFEVKFELASQGALAPSGGKRKADSVDLPESSNKRSHYDDEDYDEDYECTQEITIDAAVLKEKSPDIPETASQRLRNLKPILSGELFDAYAETFDIFKTAITSIVHGVLTNSKIPKLSSLCGLKLGKEIALSTKTTYYKLSRTLLFDPKTIPHDLQKYQQTLNDDITVWFEDGRENDPEFIYHEKRILQPHRRELMLGYLIHILAIHLDVYYLLIPVIVHWLEDEYKRTGLQLFRTLKIGLFHAFWNQNSTSEESRVFQILNGECDSSDKIFWMLHKSNYWRDLVETQSIQSNYNYGDTYNNYFLDSIVTRIGDTIYNGTNENEDKIDFIYDTLIATPNHCRVNEIIMLLINQLLQQTNISMAQTTTLSTFINNLEVSYNRISLLVTTWIGFRQDGSNLFTKVYPGNLSVFQGMIVLCNYLVSKTLKVINQMQSTVQKLDFCYTQLKEVSDNFQSLAITLKLAGSYYCSVQNLLGLERYDAISISHKLIDVLCNRKHSCNHGLNRFLLWLHYTNEEAYKYLAQTCFISYYGNKSKFKSEDIQELKNRLFL